MEKVKMETLEALLSLVMKPSRYIGNEFNVIIKEDAKCHIGFCFPDLYDIGMSFTGLQILYSIMNDIEDLSFERAFAPYKDMEEILISKSIPLFTLENKIPLKNLDMVAFTLQYELSYTNILNMLKLSGIPFLREERDESMPLIIGGGPCAFNPEPLADFFDFFLIGDGEESFKRLGELLLKNKIEGGSKNDFLNTARKVEGVYIPSDYEVSYNVDGTIRDFSGRKVRVRKAVVKDLEDAPYPVKPLVPLSQTVHDRAVVETFRGCTRGCRFCQAGMIYRPVRERTKDKIVALSKEQLKNTGHDELSLLSLSTSDLTCFEPLVSELTDLCNEDNISLSLPSLRLDNTGFKILGETQKFRKSGLTFAPEAGTQRLRDVINKGITEEQILVSVRKAIELGYNHLKLYFMIGLPTETYNDLDGIVDLTKKILEIRREVQGPSGRFNITVSLSNFVPKPFTPFQWSPQDTVDQLIEKHNYLKNGLSMKRVTFKYHDSDASLVESVISRGDRRLSALLVKALENGCKMDSWSESFNFSLWKKAFKEAGIDPYFYANRERDKDEVLPWDIIDPGINKKFLLREFSLALKGEITPDCRVKCVNCGVKRLTACPPEEIDG